MILTKEQLKEIQVRGTRDPGRVIYEYQILENFLDTIAALQSQVAILEESNKGYQRTAQTILEVKSERDALLEAQRQHIINKLQVALRSAQQENMNLPLFCRGLQQAITIIKNTVLSTPASGKPARNVMDGGKRWPKGM